MSTTSSAITDHYTTDNIADRVLTALRAVHGSDAPITPDALAPLDHLHGRGVVATADLAARLAPQRGESLLDIGSGIGGPARWIAARFGCHVTGIDLTEAFCRAAETLNAACGMQDQVRILHGSATDLPFTDPSFDRAWSQNVLMNIADKPRFYRQAFRVLRPGGLFAVDQAGMGPHGPPNYPQPWASDAANSFLGSEAEIRADAAAAGFEILLLRDVTAEAVAFIQAMRERVRMNGPPPLGLDVLLGARFRELMRNSAESLESGRTTAIQALLRRPA